MFRQHLAAGSLMILFCPMVPSPRPAMLASTTSATTISVRAGSMTKKIMSPTNPRTATFLVAPRQQFRYAAGLVPVGFKALNAADSATMPNATHIYRICHVRRPYLTKHGRETRGMHMEPEEKVHVCLLYTSPSPRD